MRRAIFVFLSLLVALSMAAIPADTISARPASTPGLSAPSPAQVEPEEEEPMDPEEEQELVSDIFARLKRARDLTSDRAIKNQIADLKKGVEAVEDLMRSGDKEGALNLKYAIAERLEIFINQLPVASPSLTNLAAAAPAANPLYDEMVNIRGKIGMLIDLEEREIPREKRPPPPTIERPPEMEKLIVYSAKFLCGPALGKEGVQPGSYSTAINIHNPNNGPVYLYKKAVLAKREDEPRGKISDFHRVILQADEAIEVDCIDIISLLGTEQEVELTTPSQQTQTILQTTAVSPVSSLIRFIKGFVVIYSTAPLDVVAVYTASTSVGFGLDVEYLSPSRVSTITYTPPPEEEAECPTGCACRTEAEAKEQGLVLCQGQEIVCAYDDNQRPLKYCFEKPTEEAEPARITLTPTQARNKVCTYHKVVATVYDASGNRLAGQKVYFHVDGANTGAGSPPGADFEATTDANGQAVFSYHGENPGEDKITAMAGSAGPVTGASKTWYTEAVEQPRAGRIVISPAQARNAVGNKHTITVIVYDTNGNPMPNVRVRISHTGAHNFAPIELTTDANGKTSYSYTGKNTGTDTIVAAVDNLSAKATKEWYTSTTSPTHR